MIIRAELKKKAKGQIKGNIGTLFLIEIIISLISSTGLGAILFPVLVIGLVSVYLGMINGEQASLGGTFSKMNLFARAWWLSILTAFFTLLWSLLLVIPGIIKTYSYSMAQYILADNPELTARQALKESKRITKGHKWELFVLQISFFMWYLLSLITFGIALIYVAPYISATTANFYIAIKDE